MTNQPTDHSRSGRALGLRGSGSGRTVRAIIALLGLLAIASTVGVAGAAEVVEVRVGRHPDFTRVVFELDRAAGYRIERSDPSSKNAELIVSLEAGSIPRRIQSSKSFIEQVVVEPSGGRSIARIRLAQGGLKLKEMILASPPRIVLDVISDNSGTSGSATSGNAAKSRVTTAAASKPSASTGTSPSTALAATTAATAKPSASPSPATKPATPAPAPTKSAQATAPAKPNQAVPAPAPKTRILASNDPSGSSAASKAAPSAPAPAARPTVAPPSTAPSAASTTSATPAATPSGAAGETALALNEAGGPSDGPSAPSEWNDGANGQPAQAPGVADPAASDTPAAADAAARAKERPMMVKNDAGDAGEEGGGLMTWALVGAGLAVAAFGGLVAVRRRRAVAIGDGDDAELAGDGQEDEVTSPFSESDEDAADEEDAEEGTRSAETSNPFAGLSGGAASFGAATARGVDRPVRGPERPADKTADKQEKKPSESLLFDDSEETKMEGMEVISRSQANELGGAMPMMGAGSDELTQMFREMQRRVAALESRIDELVDARDRLERQVAAQTEELRVQRAAIARTQRAVRNLARPEDGGDDEPTEPALREPN